MWLGGGGLGGIRLVNHWRSEAGQIAIFEGWLAHLPHSVKPGETDEITTCFWAPEHAARYSLVWEVARERVGSERLN